jgi:glycerate kinase
MNSPPAELRVVIACDSFKGSLTAGTAGAVLARELRTARPGWRVTVIPVADGGEGTVAALRDAGYCSWCEAGSVCGPLPGMTVPGGYGWVADSATAVIESAVACGLPLLTPMQRNPWLTTTRGVGELLRHAAGQNARRILLTLGGSATVDGGTGAARAFGWRFLDEHGAPVPEGGQGLTRIRSILAPVVPVPLPELQVLCDVRNPLCGPAGAARVFGPQKGADPVMVEQLETGLANLAAVIRSRHGVDLLNLSGGGAAGGFGAGAVFFFGGRLTPGFPAIADLCGLPQALNGADWVITGEGCFDTQSLHGKVVSGVRDLACGTACRVAVVAGRVKLTEAEWRNAGISAALATAPVASTEARAMARAEEFLTTAAHRLIPVLEAESASC